MDISNIKSNVQTSSADATKKPLQNNSAANENAESSGVNAQNQTKQSDSAVEIHLQSFSKQQLNMTILHKSLSANLDGFSQYSPKSLKPFDVPVAQQGDNKSLFDFEEVAKNVLSFVESALNGAAQSGASQDELNEMLSQARKGVEMGVKSARKELGVKDDSDDELAVGIKKAHDLISKGLDDLFDKFNPTEESENKITAFNYEAEYQQENSGSLTLTTKEGDTVSISFASLQAYQQQLAQISAQGRDENGDTVNLQSAELNQSFFQSNELAFSVEGELNEDELKAIGDLVGQVSKVAGQFYQGNVQAAYQQAQKLGFDDEQISNYAMDLSQKTQVMQSYTAVAGYQDDKANIPETVKRPLNEYVKDLMDMVEKSKQNLAEEKDLESIVNRVFSHQYQLTGNELFDVVNRFNHFNQKLLNSDETNQANSSDAKTANNVSESGI